MLGLGWYIRYGQGVGVLAANSVTAISTRQQRDFQGLITLAAISVHDGLYERRD